MKREKSKTDREFEEQLTRIREKWAAEHKVDPVGFIYCLRFREFTKIGWTTDLEKRLRLFHDVLPELVTFEHTIAVKDAVKAERWLHSRFKAKRKRREWFVLDDADLIFIRTLQDGFYS